MNMIPDPISHRPAKTWLKVVIEAPQDLAEAVAGFLGALSEGGVECNSGPADAPETPCELVTGYLAVDGDLQDKQDRLHAFVAEIQRRFPQTTKIKLHAERIREEDWGKKWKQHFKPAKLTKRLVVKPSWEAYAPAGNELVIEMDPGMAFGTGLHSSTRLALELIEDIYATEATTSPLHVLDVGTGTGILGMACSLFGAEKVVAVDNDPDAVAAARDNVRKNNLAQRMTVSGEALSKVGGPFDLIIANITHDVLLELTPELTGRLAAKGRVVLAGILQGEQEKSIVTACGKLGLTLVATRTEKEWVAIHFLNTAAPCPPEGHPARQTAD